MDEESPRTMPYKLASKEHELLTKMLSVLIFLLPLQNYNDITSHEMR